MLRMASMPESFRYGSRRQRWITWPGSARRRPAVVCVAEPAALPSPLPSRARRDRAAAARARGAPPEAERGGGGTRPRPFLSLRFPPRSPRLGSVPGALSSRCRRPALGGRDASGPVPSPPGAWGGGGGERERRRGAAGAEDRRAGAPRMSPLFSWVAKVGGAAPSALGK